MNRKSLDKLFTISETAKKIGLISKVGLPQSYILRFWESKFKQIKPTILNGKRRYYSQKDIDLIKFIKYLLKEQRLTIEGVKKILKNNTNSLDDQNSSSIKDKYIRNSIIKKSKIILDKIRKLKNKNGKKNTH